MTKFINGCIILDMKYFFLSIVALMFLTSCQSTKNATGSVSRPSSQNSQGTSNSSPALSSSQTTNPVQTKIDEEYARSVNTVNVSKSKFTEDKAEIMRIIGELDTVMSKNDFSTLRIFSSNSLY